MNNLKNKIDQLEEKIGAKGKVSPEDQVQVVFGSEDGVEEKLEKLKAELTEKYGAGAVERDIFFLVFVSPPEPEVEILPYD